jgi:two-component system, cell cycle response regulator
MRVLQQAANYCAESCPFARALIAAVLRMEPLVRASLHVRKLARHSAGAFAIILVAGYLLLSRGLLAGPWVLGVGVVWLGVTVRCLVRRLSLLGAAVWWRDCELGLLVGLGIEVAALGLDARGEPRIGLLLYLLASVSGAFTKRGAAVLTMLTLVLFEAALKRWVLDTPFDTAFALRSGTLLCLTILNLTFLRVEAARMQAVMRVTLDGELSRIKEDARSFRLLGAGEGRDLRAEDRVARSSVEEIHQSVHYALELLRRTLDLNTAVVFWLNDAGTHFRISELSSHADNVCDTPIAAGDGILGMVTSRRDAVTLRGLTSSYRVPYYAGACPVKALCALPIFEDGGKQLRGVLVVDRIADKPITQSEQDLAAQAARYCLRAIQNERVFLQLERAKVEQGKLYRAAQTLGSAVTEEDVVAAGVRAAREIASFDVAAVTVFDPITGAHEIVAVDAAEESVTALRGVSFQHNAGLVSMAVQNRFPLPYKGEFDARHQLVLSRRYPWPKTPSLLVLPLMLGERPLGTLVLAANRRHAFTDSVRSTLEVLASHLAVSLSNARMMKKLETMATTDGMTGLLNKRAMLEAATQKVDAAYRFKRKLSVIVTDIDFFKKVNDTYGHDVGDQVIKGLGEVLKRQKRTTDIVARFGGEEFVALCEQTDEAGALLLAERIREELGRTKFTSPMGEFSVTCSVGVATFPDGGSDWDSLFKAADEALYVSKRAGRNQTSVAPGVSAPRKSERLLVPTPPPATTRRLATR